MFSLVHPFFLVLTFYHAKTFVQMDKSDIVYPHNGMLLDVQEGCTISHRKTQRRLKIVLLSQRSQSGKATFH